MASVSQTLKLASMHRCVSQDEDRARLTTSLALYLAALRLQVRCVDVDGGRVASRTAYCAQRDVSDLSEPEAAVVAHEWAMHLKRRKGTSTLNA